ncbi:unnamed protein product [Umbelopsis vinacea]
MPKSKQHILDRTSYKGYPKETAHLVSCPALSSYRNRIDSIWHPLQELLSLIYVAQLKPAYDLGNPLLDAHVVFLELCGYDISLDDEYERVYVLENDKAFVESLNQTRVSGPLPIQIVSAVADHITTVTEPSINPDAQRFEQVAVGGTFDHIHAGHKILLAMTALLASKRLACGITGIDDAMLVRKKHRDLIASTEDRIKNVEDCLKIFRQDIEYDVMPMSDAFGPTITEEQIEALVVSTETVAGGQAVNAERAKLGWAPLQLRVIDVISPSMTSVQGHDISALKISSTWIRNYLASQQQESTKNN